MKHHNRTPSKRRVLTYPNGWFAACFSNQLKSTKVPYLCLAVRMKTLPYATPIGALLWQLRWFGGKQVARFETLPIVLRRPLYSICSLFTSLDHVARQRRLRDVEQPQLYRASPTKHRRRLRSSTTLLEQAVLFRHPSERRRLFSHANLAT